MDKMPWINTAISVIALVVASFVGMKQLEFNQRLLTLEEAEPELELSVDDVVFLMGGSESKSILSVRGHSVNNLRIDRVDLYRVEWDESAVQQYLIVDDPRFKRKDFWIVLRPPERSRFDLIVEKGYVDQNIPLTFEYHFLASGKAVGTMWMYNISRARLGSLSLLVEWHDVRTKSRFVSRLTTGFYLAS